MSVIGFLDQLLFQPLLFIYDELFRAILTLTVSPGWALVVFSVILNLVLLPVYYQMEQAGHEQTKKRSAVDKEVARIKAHFKGRERYFYIRTIHRHHRYHPISVLFSSGALYLQILVFATVFRYIENLDVIEGSAFLGIPDLSHPDGLLLGANLLPIVMTVANIVSAVAYSDGKGQRRQAFALAAIFLVLLYSSPAGLVLYWTSNNVFSLVRNVIEHRLGPALPQKLKHRLSQLVHQE